MQNLTRLTHIKYLELYLEYTDKRAIIISNDLPSSIFQILQVDLQLHASGLSISFVGKDHSICSPLPHLHHEQSSSMFSLRNLVSF